MKRSIAIFTLLSIGLIGGVDDSLAEMTKRFITLAQVRTGMTRTEIQRVLPKQVIVGYELRDPESEYYKPITVNNPHRSEVVEKGSKKYKIDYYLVGIRKADGEVSDDELVPLIFLKDKLVGKGWDYYIKKLKN